MRKHFNFWFQIFKFSLGWTFLYDNHSQFLKYLLSLNCILLEILNQSPLKTGGFSYSLLNGKDSFDTLYKTGVKLLTNLTQPGQLVSITC